MSIIGNPILLGGEDIDLSFITARANDILSPKVGVDIDGNSITGRIPTKSSSDLTASGATVTVPAGYYASQATKSVASGTASTSPTIITANPTITVTSSGMIVASCSKSENITPTVSEGYISEGTAGTITINGSATQQLTTQAGATITPGSTSQTVVTAGKYVTGNIVVAGIPLAAGNSF